MLLIALASILYGSAMAFTTTRHAPDPRLLVGRPARLHHARDLLADRPRARRARCCSRSTTASSSRPRSSSSRCSRARAGGSEDLRDMGGLAFRAPVLAALFLIVALANLAMPGLVELRRRVPDPARRLPGEDRHRDRRVHRRRDGQRLHAAAVHPRDAQPRRADGRVARDDARATALVLVPLVLVHPRAGALPAARAEALASARGQGAASSPRAGGAPARRQRRRRPPMIACSPRAARRRTSTGPALSPLIALLGGATVVLLVGLFRARAVREHARAGAGASSRSRAAIGLGDLAVGRREGPVSRRAARSTTLTLAADADLLRRGIARPCCCRGARWRRARPPTASTTR